MSRKAKGKRPAYFNDAENDKLLAITMAVAGELAVVRERLDTIERLIADRGLLTAADIDSYRPPEAVAVARENWRQDYLERILRIVHHDRESVSSGETPETYQRTIDDVSSLSTAKYRPEKV